MEGKYIVLTNENLAKEHICCAFSDKKCKEGYELKKEWMKGEFDRGYVFRRLDERAKVFIEYGPAEQAWLPVDAPGYLMIGCFWVAGQYKGKGHGKALLQSVLEDAREQGKQGVAVVTGISKFHFMGDTKWFLRQGFEISQKLPSGFCLLVKKLDAAAVDPAFRECALNGECSEKDGLVVYYSNRCPFTEYYVGEVLAGVTGKKNIPLKVIKLETPEQAQAAPTPTTIFSLFYNGKFVTTDISTCLENRLEKVLKSV